MSEKEIMSLQLALALMEDGDGVPLYTGSIDGKIGPMTKAAVSRLATDMGLLNQAQEPAKPEVSDSDTPEIPGNAVLVFSRKADSDKLLSEHFRVREFACHDGTDAVFVHPILPTWAEAIREINGPFSPTSAYRTTTHNATIGGAAYSQHCLGTAMDIPAVNATPEELYAKAEEIMGCSGGLGIYDWGIHMDCRAVPARWDERGK